MTRISITKLFSNLPAIKQAEIARLAKLSPQHLHALKSGTKRPTPEVISRINRALEMVEKQLSKTRI